MTNKFRELKAAAMAATPGPWESVYDDWSDGDDALISCESRDGMVAIAKIEGGGSESGYDEPFSNEQQANTAFIAAANPAAVLALLTDLEAKDKRIAEVEGSHKKLRETLAAVHNTITGGGAYTSLAGILTAVKRAYLESSDASASTVTVEGD